MKRTKADRIRIINFRIIPPWYFIDFRIIPPIEHYQFPKNPKNTPDTEEASPSDAVTPTPSEDADDADKSDHLRGDANADGEDSNAPTQDEEDGAKSFHLRDTFKGADDSRGGVGTIEQEDLQ